MPDPSSPLLYATVMFTIVFSSGFWLSRSGKPYGSLLLNVHKLVGFAGGALTLYHIYRINNLAPLAFRGRLLAAATALVFLGLLVTGGLLSTENPMPDIVRWVHHLAPYGALLVGGLVLYLL